MDRNSPDTVKTPQPFTRGLGKKLPSGWHRKVDTYLREKGLKFKRRTIDSTKPKAPNAPA